MTGEMTDAQLHHVVGGWQTVGTAAALSKMLRGRQTPRLGLFGWAADKAHDRPNSRSRVVGGSGGGCSNGVCGV